jgi:hypothetical protein
MANRFIPYIPKTTNKKYSSKLLCKNMLVDSTWQIEQNSAPIRASAVTLTEICKSNGDEDEDDMYFPTVQELIARRGVSREHAPKAVDKPALDNDDNSVNHDKSVSGPNSGNSQGISATPSS